MHASRREIQGATAPARAGQDSFEKEIVTHVVRHHINALLCVCSCSSPVSVELELLRQLARQKDAAVLFAQRREDLSSQVRKF